MYVASLNHYVKKNPEKSNFCITPDCEQIYTWESKELCVQCSTCFVSICTACKVENHEGLTCAQYKSLGEQDAAYAKWKKENSNVKSCPKCKVDIEKAAGCNHMVCANCKTHICWVCLAVFDDSKATYDHMSSKHGGFYQT